jgi:hypothetical protein
MSPYSIPGIVSATRLKVKTYTKDELVEAIRKSVIGMYNLEGKKVLSKSRKRELVIARHIMRYMARSLTKMSLKEIGQEFPGDGPADHTTIMHSVRTTLDLMDTDPQLKAQVIDMRKSIEGGGILIKGEKRSPIPECMKTREKYYSARRPRTTVIVEREITMAESEKVMAKYL